MAPCIAARLETLLAELYANGWLTGPTEAAAPGSVLVDKPATRLLLSWPPPA